MLHWSIECPSRDRNKCKAMNGSVSLAVSISHDNSARCLIYSVLLVVIVLVVCKFLCDHLMFDNSHYLKTRAETVSTMILHPRLILAK